MKKQYVIFNGNYEVFKVFDDVKKAANILIWWDFDKHAYGEDIEVDGYSLVICYDDNLIYEKKLRLLYFEYGELRYNNSLIYDEYFGE